MTSTAAIHEWLSGFLTAYEAGNVPQTATMPYLVHRTPLGSWEDEQTSMEVDLYYPAGRVSEVNAKANEIRKALGLGGVTKTCDGGAVWLMRGTPFAQSIDEDDCERRYINIDLEFLTTD